MEVPRAEPGYPGNGVVEADWDEAGPLDLMSTAALLGARAWVERELHAVVGSWVGDAHLPAAVVAFDGLAMRHAWRSEVLLARLPQLRELPTDRVVVTPGPATTDLVAALRALTDDGARIGAWSAVGRALEDGYAAHLARTTPVADAPLQRWLPLLLDSVRADLELASVRRPEGSDDEVERVAALVRATAQLTR
ncbi:hypothetical protein [Dermatobacter hominis]|uniref:hypothetical protein n=1 Tax=Dermatobacter hominis TaxID=2884263 RepID=UPI001D12C039|nr:hypothetical protein [Dermatobacter hominis]UDY34413.1 hypothetical protein LH044_13835 [Dermatobacter hominis]